MINDDNFVLYAAKCYDAIHHNNTEEFFDDLKRFKYIKRLFSKYDAGGELKERLILNHIVILYNSFGEHTTKMLFFKLDGYHEFLKPFIVLLGYMPETIRGIGSDSAILYSSDIHMDENIVTKLRNI